MTLEAPPAPALDAPEPAAPAPEPAAASAATSAAASAAAARKEVRAGVVRVVAAFSIVLGFNMAAGIGLVAIAFVLWLQDHALEELTALLADPAALDGVLRGLLGTPWLLAASAVISSGSLFAAALVLERRAPAGLRTRLRLGASRFSLPMLVLVCAGSLGLSELLGSALAELSIRNQSTLEVIREAMRRADGGMLAALVLCVGVLPGVGEELFFRGFSQPRLAASWGRPWGLVATAALFGLIHMDPVHSTFAFFFGLWLGWVADAAGSIRPAIAAHAVNNVVATLGARLDGPTPLWAIATGGALFVAALLAVAVAARRDGRDGLNAPGELHGATGN